MGHLSRSGGPVVKNRPAATILWVPAAAPAVDGVFGREERLLLNLRESNVSETKTEIEAYGGPLVDLMVAPERASELKAASAGFPSWDLTERQVCDLEMLMNGSF